MAYDIIGDIHGQADKLEALLRKLGYKEGKEGWRHPERQAIFVGDFIDRGPRQLHTLSIVRRMVESGAAQAVMGNHELNAIAWHTPHPEKEGEYLRNRFNEKGEKNRRQHARFLEEIEHTPDVHRDTVDWFYSLPLWLDLPEIRVVHACWHSAYIDLLGASLDEGNRLSESLLPVATIPPKEDEERSTSDLTVYDAVQTLLRGPDVPLPYGLFFLDKDGVERRRLRIRWWDCLNTTYAALGILPRDVNVLLPDEPIQDHLCPMIPSDKPIFFGHYWMTGTPRLQADHMACLDYSAGKGGPLVAYRWDGESKLSPKHFIGTD
jgi:hypothetical protein